jgi:hypothetical protein
MPSTTIAGYNRRLSIVIILLASLAVLLVVTSIAAFVYVTRKGEDEDENRLIWFDCFRKNPSKMPFDIRYHHHTGRIGIFNCCC